MRPIAAIVLFGGVLAACGNSDNNDGSTDPDLSCDAIPDPHCDHPIDRIVIPKLRALDLAPRDGSPDEVCRRMAIDLVGRAPSPAELATCRAATYDEMADMFLSSSEFARTQRRAWGELVKYESLLTWSRDIADLDALVGSLYANTIGYAEFATRFVVHPAFYGLHPDDSWTAMLFSIFVGRSARADEIDAMRPLVRMWTQRLFCDRGVWWNYYSYAIANGASEPDAIIEGDRLCYDAPKIEWGVNLCRCQPGLLFQGCTTTALGTPITIEPTCFVPEERDPVNYRRLRAETPNTDDLCPDNVTHRPECADRARGAMEYTFEPFVEWAQLPPAQLEDLDVIGAALAARDDFWEAAADRELRKLLGWWQATFRHPDSDLPAVRALLAARLRDGASIRDVIKLIVTSQLYVQPAATPATVDATDLPPWIAGPSKLLSGESWLATAASALGETAGLCDFRWGQAGQWAPNWVDVRLVEPAIGSLEALFPRQDYPPHGYSITSIQRLGGCTGDARRPDVSNVGLAFAQSNIARELCAMAADVTPPGWSGDLVEAAAHLVERIWSRAPAAGEAELLASEMQQCIAAGPTAGCADADTAARWSCRRLVDSVPFATY
jgi:hypothetical protein